MKIYAIRDLVAATTAEHFIAQNDEEAKRLVGFAHRSDPFINDKNLFCYADFSHGDVTDALMFSGSFEPRLVGSLRQIVPEIWEKYAPAGAVRETVSSEVEDNG